MTPAVTMVRKAGVRFKIHSYDHDPDAESFGGEAAEKLSLPEDRVFKTLLVSMSLSQRECLVVAVVPVGGMLDLKRLASALGGKRAVMADVVQAQRATGYLVGGISPLGQKRRLPTVIDETALQFETVFVSAGRRGLEIELSPEDLKTLTDAKTGVIAAE